MDYQIYIQNFQEGKSFPGGVQRSTLSTDLQQKVVLQLSIRIKDMWSAKSKKIGINLLEYMFGAIISFLTYNIFVSLGMLEFLNIDIVPYISAQQIAFFLGVCICYMLIWNLTKRDISVLHIALKKYIYEIHFMLYIASIVVWYKCSNTPKLICIYAFEILLFYMILENQTIKIFDYKFSCDLNIVSNYEEKSVIGRNNLIKSQKMALNQLINILDKRTTSDSSRHY